MAEIILKTGEVALIDDEDLLKVSEHVWYGHRPGSGKLCYAFTSMRMESGQRKTVGMHRLVMGFPKGLDVDHINGNSLDNRRGNLRCATRGQNLQNQSRRMGGASQYRGVCKAHGQDRWRAAIQVNYQRIAIGTFASEVEAAQAYDAQARELFGEFARLNFPESHEQAA